MGTRRESRATIVDVAEAAGVAVGTASNALSGKGRVSAATRARVAKAAADLEFVPHRAARGLPTGRTMTIGLRFGHEATIPGGEFFVDMLDAAAEEAERHGYGLLICRDGGSGSALVDAHLVVDPAEGDDLPEAQGGVPVVTIGRNSAPTVPWVDVDHEAAMRTLLDHLAGRSGDGPVWLVTMSGHLAFLESLERACRAWAQEAGRECVVQRSGGAARELVELMQGQLEESAPPALVATALDWQAIGVQHALVGAGIEVPLGSASDGDALSLITPPVSAMALDGAAHGRVAVGMLFDWLRTREVPQNQILPTRLRAR